MKQTMHVQEKILQWYKINGRDLPWRKTHDPYTILVSELMLQQTQVERVVVKLPLFLTRFPHFSSLAYVPVGDVIKSWQGMGYNNRIIRFQKLAQVVMEKYGGVLPKDTESLLKLPGIGKYTAHAVACFAFRARVPLVDINIRRIYSRVFTVQNSFQDLMSEGDAWIKAMKILPKEAYDYNQALMDLGALICKASSPKCMNCPIAGECKSAHRLVQGNHPLRVEHSRKGVPNRIYRGRIIEYLRNHGAEKSVVIAKKVVPGFSLRELPWLRQILSSLVKDGLLIEKESLISLP